MPGLTVLNMSSHVPQAMGIRLEKRKDRTASLRRPRRSRSFRNRGVRVACETRRARDDIEVGKSSTSSSLMFPSGSSLLMQSHGEKVRCLIKMIDQQRQLFEQVQMSPIQQLQVRRFRSLFALAQHFDNKSNAKLDASQNSPSGNDPEQGANQLGAELAQMSISS